MTEEKCCNVKSHALLLSLVKILFVICQNNILQFDSVLDCFFVLLVTRSRRRIEDGGDQEEDAGHEGREGQPDGQM